jgi:hypothetical protein
MRLKNVVALLVAPLLVLLLAGAARLVDPTPLAVPVGLSEAAVDKAVRVGVSKRGWIISKQDKGYLEAVLHVRTHMAKIGITYDTKQVALKYLDSEDLDYTVKSDGPYIHAKYLQWANNVLLDINVQLQTAAVAPAGS